MKMTAARRQSTRAGCRCRGPSAEDDPRQSTPSLRRPLGSIGGAIHAMCQRNPSPYRMSLERGVPPARSRVRAYVRPPLLLCPLRFFPSQDCDDRPAPSSAFRIPPPPDDPDPEGGDAATPEGPNSASALLRGASNSSPIPTGISAAPPVVIVVFTVIIIIVVYGTNPSTLSLRVGRPITRGPVDVDLAVGAAAAELFDILSVPPPRGRRRGHRQEWSLLPPRPRLGCKGRKRRKRRRSHNCQGEVGEDAFVAFVVEVVPPPLRGKGGHVARALTLRA
jgi:hypothetical protein